MIKSPNTILRLLRSKKTEVKVRKFTRAEKKKWRGFCYTERGTIHIDIDCPCEKRVSTLVHECLHLLNPRFPHLTNDEEDTLIIEPMERKIFASLSEKQYNELKQFVV